MRRVFYLDIWKCDTIRWTTKPIITGRRFPRGLTFWIGPFQITIDLGTKEIRR